MLYTIKLVNHYLKQTNDLSLEIKEIDALLYTNETRLTVLDLDGNVLADSDKIIDKNHLKREEVIEARETGVGYAVRYSETSRQRMLYVAYYEDTYIVRVAVPYQGKIDIGTMLLLPFLVGGIMSLFIASAVAKKLAKRLSKPVLEIGREVHKMNQEEKMSFGTYEYDEYTSVANSLLTQEAIIQNTLSRLKIEKKRIATIVDQMQEGFILLDRDMKILIVNQKAKEVLNSGMQANRNIKEYIFDQQILNTLVEKEVQHRVDLTKDSRIYSCFINKVEEGITLLFVEVTQSREAAKMRQEFFSNVSHELKTPMTAIKGYSELLQVGMVQDEVIKKEMLDKIQKEVMHMATLINDILTISRLETKDIQVQKYPIRMKLLVEDVVSSLFVEATKKEVAINTSLDDVFYEADGQHMHQLVNNLISNAIKYNTDGGTVTIKVYERMNNLYIEVSDTGIGISQNEQDRVFERFYRCDKARSRSIGGTGLGLSIVKHIVQYYLGSIQLQSTMNEGTTIIVVLPKK